MSITLPAAAATGTRAALRRIVLVLMSGVLLLAGLATLAPAEAEAARPGPFYYIVAVHSNKPIMPLFHSKDHGAEIIQANWQDGGALHWNIRRSGTIDGQERIRRFENRHSKYCVSSRGYQSPVGLTQSQCTSFHTLSEEWTVSSANDMWAGRPFAVQNRSSKLCMDVAYASTADHARVGQYYCNGQDNQRFRLVYVSGT